MRRFALVLLFLVLPAVAQGQTVTVRDVLELTKAGLSEEVLLALIEVHRPVFPVDPETLKMLKQAGVAPAVIVAMVRSGRVPSPEPPPLPVEQPLPAAPPPQVVVIDHEQRDEPRIREVAVPVAVPVYVPVRTRRTHDDHYDRPRPAAKPVEPVYWGWGGKLRPDAWKPSPAETKPPGKK